MARESKSANQSASSKMLSRRALVNIHRDTMTNTPRVIWQHEMPILEAVFGEGNVRPIDSAVMDEGYSAKVSPELLPFNKKQDPVLPPSETASIGYVFVGDPRVEYERLAAIYGRHPEVNMSMAEHVYGRFQDGRFVTVVGSAEVEDLPESQLRELARDHGYIPLVSKESSEAEKTEAATKRLELQTMPHAQLVKLADELGVVLN